MLPETDAVAVLTLSVIRQAPHHSYVNGATTRVIWTLRDAVAAFHARRARAEREIRHAIWPMCEKHLPGRQIIDTAAQYQGDTIDDAELVTLCRTIAAQVMRKARHAV